MTANYFYKEKNCPSGFLPSLSYLHDDIFLKDSKEFIS